MSNGNTPHYTFVPWLKRGLSGLITQEEGNGLGTIGRTKVNLEIELERLRGSSQSSTVFPINQQVNVRGPGDILSINSSAIIRVEPQHGIANFEWNYLPYVDFGDEDFPWRYSPAAAHIPVDQTDHSRLSPWVYLLVLKSSEFELSQVPGAAHFLQFVLNDNFTQEDVNGLFVPPSELWAWAHAQLNKSLEIDEGNGIVDQQAILNEIEADKNLAFSRLLSPRKLEKDQEYHAFIIPSFLSGWQVGMGMDSSNTDSLAYAWPESPSATEGVPLQFPYYHKWSFRTAPDGDFEVLADKLTPHTTEPDVGVRPLDIHNTGWGVDSENLHDKVVGLQSALRPPTLITQPFIEKVENEEYVNSLEHLLNANDLDGENTTYPNGLGGSIDDPIVLPPLYGQWHALKKRVHFENNGEETPWFEELNIDPRNRAVAGMGSTIVKENQEEFMEEAWNQVDSVVATNQRIRQAQLMAKVGECIFNKHIKNPKDTSAEAEDRLLRMTSPTMRSFVRVESGKSMKIEFDESRIPNAMRSGTFRKLSRPGSKASKRISTDPDTNLHTAISRNFLVQSNNTEVEDGTRFFRPHASPIEASSIAEMEQAASATESNLNTTGFYSAAPGSSGTYTEQAQSVSDDLSNRNKLEKTALEPDSLQVVQEKTNPAFAVKDRVLSTIEIWNEDSQDFQTLEDFDPIMAYPEIDEPLYNYLEKISHDFIIPNAHRFESNSITLLETNPRFLDAFFAGVNHEMSRELLWREYPTDMRGSYFRYFWDRESEDLENTDPDISLISDWSATSALGNQQENVASQIVLVIRGELIDKFPDTLIYAQKATYDGTAPTSIDAETQRKVDVNTEPIFPSFRARVGGDIVILGFDLNESEVRGVNEDASAFVDYGYYFILQERPGQTRFGLDDPGDGGANQNIGSWDDLSWGHLDDQVNVIRPMFDISENEFNHAILYRSSADMASILYQKPFMMLVHGLEMLEPISIGATE